MFSDIIPTVIAVSALLVSVVTAWAQIRLQSQEWLPYLTYEKITVSNTSYKADELILSFYMKMRNVGRCVLRYEVTRFNINIDLNNDNPYVEDDVRRWISFDEQDRLSGVIGIKSDTFYKSTFHSTSFKPEYRILFNEEGVEKAIKIQCRIDITIAFWKINGAGARYELDQEVHLTQYENGEWVETRGRSDFRETGAFASTLMKR